MNSDKRFCCALMQQNIEDTKIIHYSEIFDEFGINMAEDKLSYILISHCPWCGSVLPDSKRTDWFDQLEKLGFEDPISRDDIPIEYRSAKWRSSRSGNGLREP